MINTNWIVFTGAPCSGKTTVLDRLKKQGYHYVPEVARIYIESELAKGRDLKAIRENEGEFQRGLILAKAEIEEKLDPQETIFLDRAMPDSISYYKLAGLNPSEVFELSNRYRYHQVFIFDRLPIEFDHARTENDSERELLDSVTPLMEMEPRLC
jgi:predicted ATPase